MNHPLSLFTFCPVCGKHSFEERNEKAKECTECGFVYYFNPSAAVACFIQNKEGEVLLVRRALEPAKGTLDLPGGFIDMGETAEEAIHREVKEETGLTLTTCRYLFSLPNIYPYLGFDVHTLDMFFECEVEEFTSLCANDDAEQIVTIPLKDLNAADFGLESIKRAVSFYQTKY